MAYREKMLGEHCKCPNGCDNAKHTWYDSKWDRFFCKKCNIWLETGCGCGSTANDVQMECYYQCWKCPATPNPAKTQQVKNQ